MLSSSVVILYSTFKTGGYQRYLPLQVRTRRAVLLSMRARAKASLVACSALVLLRLIFFVPEESTVRLTRPSLRSLGLA